MERMNLGLNLAMTLWDEGPEPNLSLAIEAERLGYSSVWTEEAYGSDAVVPLAWIAANTTRIDVGSAVWQVPARTPAMAAMTAATLDKLSGGRLRVGLGASGPQVVEGWHGQPYERPLRKTREYMEIMKRVIARERPVAFEGKEYALPYSGEGGLAMGKPLNLILHPLRPEIPFYFGALGPKNVEMTAELADGWLPIFMAPKRFEATFGESLAKGFEKAGAGKRPGNGFDVAPIVSVVVGDDIDACRRVVKEKIGLYIGGMGSTKKNFSNQLIARFGFEEVSDEVQERFMAGDREGAVEAVSDELVDEIALCGTPDRIDELLEDWRDSPVTTIILDTDDAEALRVMAELLPQGSAR